MLARWLRVTYSGSERFAGQCSPVNERPNLEPAEPRLSKPAMYRLTARLLLVLLLAGTFVPAALALSAPMPQACCMRMAMHDAAMHACCPRKPMHDHGSRHREIQAVGCQHQNCSSLVTTAFWAELGSGIDSNFYPPLAYLSPESHPVRPSNQASALQPVRGPPLN